MWYVLVSDSSRPVFLCTYSLHMLWVTNLCSTGSMNYLMKWWISVILNTQKLGFLVSLSKLMHIEWRSLNDRPWLWQMQFRGAVRGSFTRKMKYASFVISISCTYLCSKRCCTLIFFQVFLDVVENVNILVNSNGQIIRSEVIGAMKMRTYLRCIVCFIYSL